MIYKNLDAINSEDIRRLVEESVSESRTLDYKQELKVGINSRKNGEKTKGEREQEEKDKADFLHDICAFANTMGGDLIYGIQEKKSDHDKTGIAGKIVGIQDFEEDSLSRRLSLIIDSGVEPKIWGIRFKAVTMEDGCRILIIRVPSSWNAPHMVKSTYKFYAREEMKNHIMDVDALRYAFVQSETIFEKINQFRLDRISKIVEFQKPFKLFNGPKVIIHIIPLQSFRLRLLRSSINLNSIDDLHLLFPPMTYSREDRYGEQYNLDGFMTTSFTRDPKSGKIGQLLSYVQFFRDGSLEIVDSTIASDYHAEIVSGYERNIVRSVENYISSYKKIEIQPPYFIGIAIIDAKGYVMSNIRKSSFPPDHEAFGIDTDTLIIPDVLMQDFEKPLETVLKPIFDIIWQATGQPRSLNYDADGNWIGYR